MKTTQNTIKNFRRNNFLCEGEQSPVGQSEEDNFFAMMNQYGYDPGAPEQLALPDFDDDIIPEEQEDPSEKKA